MKNKFNILIADRNPHVREFLKRELTTDDYQVLLADNAREVLKFAYNDEILDLVIIDPDLPDADFTSVLTKLRNRIPVLPVVIHAFPSDYDEQLVCLKTAVFVEKRGNSVETLKKVASDILENSLKNKEKVKHENETG